MITPESLAASGTEHGNQAAVFQWCALNRAAYPDTQWLFAIPNGGLRHKVIANKMKAEGAKAGVPDMMLPIPRLGYNGMFIELKVGKGKASATQAVWHTELRRRGYNVVTCVGWFEVVSAIAAYLGWR